MTKLIIVSALWCGVILPALSEPHRRGQQECDSLTIAAASLMNSRNNGATKQGLLSALPSLKQSPYQKDSAKYLLLTKMYQMVEEVFAYDSLDATAYMIFKSESCIRNIQGEEVVSYENAYPELKLCGQLEANDELIECSMKAAGAN